MFKNQWLVIINKHYQSIHNPKNKDIPNYLTL